MTHAQAHQGHAADAHNTSVCSTVYCGRLPGQTEADVESPLREGVRATYYGPEDMGVSVVIPGADPILFRGGENDLQQLSEYSRRDIAVARALLQDAMNRLDTIQHPYPISVPVAPRSYPGPSW